MNVRPVAVIALISATIWICGCSTGSREGSEIQGVSADRAASLQAEQDRFGSDKEPSITADTHFAAGQLAESQGEAEKAVEQYEAALKIDPHHVNSLYRLGIIQTRMKAYAAAIGTWKSFLDASNHHATGYSNLGYCYELAGQPAEAEAAYQEGIARDGRNVPCRVNYGVMLARAGRANEALIQLQAVLPEAQVHYNLGSVYEQSGRKDQARAEYRKAMELDASMSDAKARLAALE